MGRILLLTMGGTIVQARNKEGALGNANTDLFEHVPSLRQYDIDLEEVCNKDSTNVTAEERRKAAIAVHHGITRGYDGIVITHGTDSLAKTGAYLSFAVPNPGIPVILTGAQRTLTEPESDAPANVLHAVQAAHDDFQGYAIAFHDKLLQANRAVKRSSTSLDAFLTPNEEPLAYFTPSTPAYRAGLTPRSQSLPQVNIAYEPVQVYEITTDDDPRTLLALMQQKQSKGLIIKGLGAGNIPDRLAKAVKRIVENGKPVVIVSNCLQGNAMLEEYETGRNALKAGAISAKDMTLDAAQMKLGIALGTAKHYKDPMQYIRSYMERPVAEEFGVPKLHIVAA